MKTGNYKESCKEFEVKYKDHNKTGQEMYEKAEQFVGILSTGFNAGKQYIKNYYYELLFCYMEVMNKPINKKRKKLLNNFEDRLVVAIDSYCRARDIECGMETED